MKRGIFGVASEELPQKGRLVINRRMAAHENWVETILPGEPTATNIESETSKRPLLIFGLVIAVCMGILIARLIVLQVMNGERNLGLAEGNRIRQRVIRAPRGILYDRAKLVLVRNVASFDVVVVPQLLPKSAGQRAEVTSRLSAIIGVSQDDIASAIDLKHLSPAQPRLVAAGIDRDKALALDQVTSEFPGFSLDVNPSREYMDQGEMPHILGYTGRVSAEDLKRLTNYFPTDYIGKLGLERQYEEALKGQNGSERTEVDALGRPIRVLASQPAAPGQNLILTLDQELQTKITAALKTQLSAAGAKRASAVALNPKTGEVLASVSLPGYDNNLFAKGISSQDFQKLVNDPAQPLFNKAVDGAYPTGSIIKPLVAAAALEEKVITPQTSINDIGYLEVKNKYDPNAAPQRFYSYEKTGLGIVNVYSALQKSSNVFFFTVGGGFGNITGLGVNRLVAYYQQFGLGGRTGIDLPSETKGLVPTPELKKINTGDDWRLGDTFNISVGQGDLLASPLQMAVATAAIANGGTVYKPYILKAVVDETGKTVRVTSPEAARKLPISLEVLTTVRAGMRQVVASPEGTACCRIEQEVPVKVAAKTGTAETDSGGSGTPHAWFSAFAPYEDPQIVLVILVEKSGEGSKYAAPAAREVLTWCFNRPGGCIK